MPSLDDVLAEASKNKVLKSLMLIITPDIANNFITYNVCNKQTELKALQEHKNILDCIIKKNGETASAMMHKHLQDVLDFSRTT